MNKLCPHIIGSYSGPLGNARAVKLVNPSIEYVKQMQYMPLVVVRWVEGIDLRDPERAVNDWWARHFDFIKLVNAPNVIFEALNERTNAEIVHAAAFEELRLRRAHQFGVRSVILNASEGTFEFSLWQHALPAIRAMDDRDFCGLHEYGNGRYPPTKHPNFPWHVGRFTSVPELRGVPKLITECGVDMVEGGARGWKAQFGGDWPAYLAWLTEMDAFYSTQPEVYAAFVFTLGTGGDLNWTAFDVAGQWGDVVAQYGPPPEPSRPPREERMYKLSPFLRYWDRWKVTRPFGFRDPKYTDGWHKGTDLVRSDGGTHGAVILCPFELALVDVVTWRADRGWYIYLYDEGQGCEFFACHLAMEPECKPGDYLERGEVIAHVGNTGSLTTGAHIHAGLCRVDEELNIQEWVDLFGDQVKITEEV